MTYPQISIASFRQICYNGFMNTILVIAAVVFIGILCATRCKNKTYRDKVVDDYKRRKNNK